MENVSAKKLSIRAAVKEFIGDEQCAIIVTAQKGDVIKQRRLTRKDLFITNKAVADFSSITGIPVMLFTEQEICKVDFGEGSVVFALSDSCIWTITRADNPDTCNTLHLNSTRTGFENASYIEHGDLYILNLGRSFVDNKTKEELFSNSPFNILCDSTSTQNYLTLCYAKKNGKYCVGLWDTVNSRQVTALLQLSPKIT